MKNKYIFSILLIILVLSLGIALVACSNGGDDTDDGKSYSVTPQIAKDILANIELGNNVSVNMYDSYNSVIAYTKNTNNFVVYLKNESGSSITETYIGAEGGEYYIVMIENDYTSITRSHIKVAKWEAEKALAVAQQSILNDYVSLSNEMPAVAEQFKSWGDGFGNVKVYGNAYKQKANDIFPENADINYSAQIVDGVDVLDLILSYQISGGKLSFVGVSFFEVEDYVSDNQRVYNANRSSFSMNFDYNDTVRMPSDKGTLITPEPTTTVYLKNTATLPLYEQVRGEKISLPTPTDDGEFLGWYYDADYQLPIEGDYRVGYYQNEVYAKWNLPKAKLELNGGYLTAEAENALQDCIFVSDIRYKVGYVYKKGYSFDGWFADADLTQSIANDDTLIKSNTTVYAKWIPLKTITLSADVAYSLPKLVGINGNNNHIDDVVITKKGSLFEGWYTDSNFQNPAPKTFGASNATYYAKFTPAICVEFNFDNAILTPSNVDYYINIPLTETAEYTFKDLYYQISNDYNGGSSSDMGFDGWYTNSALTQEFSSYPTGNITLYPKLAPLYYLSINAGEGSFSEYSPYEEYCVNWIKADKHSITEYLDIVLDELIAPDGKVFAGWYSDAALTTPYPATAFPTSSTTIYAKFA